MSVSRSRWRWRGHESYSEVWESSTSRLMSVEDRRSMLVSLVLELMVMSSLVVMGGNVAVGGGVLVLCVVVLAWVVLEAGGVAW